VVLFAFRMNRGDYMNRFVVSILSLALTFAGFIARASGDARTTQLLAQARAAVGGESKLAKIQGLSAAGTFQRQAGDRQFQGELTLDVQLPDKMVRTDSMNPIGDTTIVVLQGINGDQVLRNTRTINGGPNMMIRMAPPGAGSDAEAQALRNQRAEFARLALAMLLTSPASMPLEYAYTGEAESDEGKADVLDAKGPGSFAVKLFLDKTSHRPLMLQYRGAAPRIVMQTPQAPRGARQDIRPGSENPIPLSPPDAPQIVDITMFLDDYRAVDGLLLPHHIARSIDGNPNEEWTFRTITLNPTFKPDTFSGK
jgi:hypothetical protein